MLHLYNLHFVKYPHMLYLNHLIYNFDQYNQDHIQVPKVFFQIIFNKKKVRTRSDVTTSTIPIGMNIKPIIKKTGRAVFAVMIGCHAGKRCCLKAVSRINNNRRKKIKNEIKPTSWFFAFLLFAIFFRFWLS